MTVFGSSDPSDGVSIVVGFSNFGIGFAPELHRTKDEDEDEGELELRSSTRLESIRFEKVGGE